MVHEQKVMFYCWTVIFDFDFVLLFTPADTVFSISIFPYLNWFVSSFGIFLLFCQISDPIGPDQ